MVPIAAPLAGAPLMLRRELADGLTVGEGYAPLVGSTWRRVAYRTIEATCERLGPSEVARLFCTHRAVEGANRAPYPTQTGPSKERTALLTHRWAWRVITRHS
jgi:hypothetical protein